MSLMEKSLALRDILCYESGIELRPYQVPLSNLVTRCVVERNSAEIAALWSRQSGKTETLTDTILPLMATFNEILKTPLRVGIFAPAQSQSVQVFRLRVYDRYSKMRGFLEQTGNVMKRHIGEMTYSSLFILRSVNTNIESRIRFMSGAPGGQIIGETLDLAVIEQVENIQAAKMIADIFPMLSSTGGVRVLSGTPSLSITNSYYYDVLTKPTKQRPPSGTNPQGSYISTVDWKEACKYSPKYREYVNMEIPRIGLHSDEFRTAYGLEWILAHNKFIDRESLDALESEYISNKKLPRFVGWDPARESDRSIMTCVERDGDFKHHILEWYEWDSLNWETQLSESMLFLKRWRPNVLLIDSTGLGNPVLEFAQKWCRNNLDFPLRVEGYHYSSESKDSIGKLMDAEFQNKRITFPKACPQNMEKEHFKEDFLNLERNYKGNYMNLDHPSRSGCHNDYCTSLELAIWASLRLQFRPYAGVTELF